MKTPRNSENAALVNPLESHVGYQLRRASVILMADLGTRLVPTGLRPTDVSALLVIRANPGCRQGAVGELLGIKPANMVPLVARMVKSGLVERIKADGRSHALSLTPLGRATTARVKQLLERHDSAIKSRLEKEELTGLLSSLSTLRCLQE